MTIVTVANGLLTVESSPRHKHKNKYFMCLSIRELQLIKVSGSAVYLHYGPLSSVIEVTHENMSESDASALGKQLNRVWGFWQYEESTSMPHVIRKAKPISKTTSLNGVYAED